MSGQSHQPSAEDPQNMRSTGNGFGSYEGTSGETTPAASPELASALVGGYLLPQYPWFFNKSTEFLPQGPGSIPIEVEFEAPYDDQDRRKRRTRDDKPVSSHVHSRRRAQNRASQRAFRDRKEKHTKELGQRLEDLELKHQHLMRSYEDLQAKYENAREKLEMLSNDNEIFGDPLDSPTYADSRLMKNGDLNSLFFDESDTFLFHGAPFDLDKQGGPSMLGT